MFIELITLGAFLVICLLVFLIGDTINGGRRTARSIAESQFVSGNRASKWGSLSLQLKRAIAGVIPQSNSEIEKIERDLKRAGYYKSTALLEYMATRNTLVVGVIVLTGILSVIADPTTLVPQWILAGGLVTVLLGYGLPRMMLHWQAGRRIDRIQRGLPDALDIVRMCLASGLPLREAFKRVTDEIRFFHPDIAVEFEVIRRHADADTMGNALRQFANRLDTPDINAMATIVTQSERLGTHVATAIADYADSVRVVHRQKVEEKASKTSIKMLFPVILCLAPPIYILLCGPPMLKLRNFIIEGHQPGGVLDTPANIRTLNSTDNAAS